MFNFKSSVHHLSLAALRHARLFQGDQRGSISILGATFIALLLGIGTVAMKVGDSYVAKLRDFRTADIAAHAITKTANGTQIISHINDDTYGSTITCVYVNHIR